MMEEPRVAAFRALRPPCVELSQVALKHKAKKATGQEVIKALETVHSTLMQIVKRTVALDSKLADYVFFPLSHVFRDVKDLPARAIEIALQCLRILICDGWKDQMSAEMGKQLLILLCFLAGGTPQEAKVKKVHEELAVAALECLATLVEASECAGLGDDCGLIRIENVPILGHTVTVLLDAILDGTTAVRVPAFAALTNLIGGMRDKVALRNVFPGIVSTITKVLSYKSTERPSFKILVNGIELLGETLMKAIADNGESESSGALTISNEADEADLWVEATAGQVRMALANVMPLRYHEDTKVQRALKQLCVRILENCRTPLHQSLPMIVETLVILSSHPSTSTDASVFDVGLILAADISLLEMLKNALHDWIIAMPHLMQSNDDVRKARIVDQITMAFRILESQGVNLDMLNDAIAVNLQASVSTAMQVDPSSKIAAASENILEVSRMLRPAERSSAPVAFGPILFHGSSSISTMIGLKRLAHQLLALPMSTKLQQGIAGPLETTSGDEQLASLWLSLQILYSTSSDGDITDQYLNLPAVSETQESLLDSLYSFSIDVLSKSTFEDSDRWELQALSLEALALQARQQKTDFRPELVDVLYPILERLGSSNSTLQSHALTCLSIVSSSCEYPSPASLIVDNADYLVNAISLKLTTFGISPQAPQVLVMMIRLCGSDLIPHLDDLVESIFSILACYHGYPKLVESLFSILNAIVEEAAKTNDKMIDYRPDGITKPQFNEPITINDVATLLASNREKASQPHLPPLDPNPSDEDPNAEPPPRPSSPPPAPLSKTTSLIKSITDLTPTHLTSPSAPLRANLLSLLSTALPILAADANTLLPVSATLFPLLSTRLFSTSPDALPFEILAAAEAMAVLCDCSGDFLASRVQDAGWWSSLVALFKRSETGMKEERRAMGGRGRGMRWRLWDGVVGLIIGVVKDVGVGDELEDAVFEMLGQWVVEQRRRGVMDESRRREVREVLARLNADALWLVEERERVRAGGESRSKPEKMEGREFRSLDI